MLCESQKFIYIHILQNTQTHTHTHTFVTFPISSCNLSILDLIDFGNSFLGYGFVIYYYSSGTEANRTKPTRRSGLNGGFWPIDCSLIRILNSIWLFCMNTTSMCGDISNLVCIKFWRADLGYVCACYQRAVYTLFVIYNATVVMFRWQLSSFLSSSSFFIYPITLVCFWHCANRGVFTEQAMLNLLVRTF